jgi:PAS domain S-box-containing protein
MPKSNLELLLVTGGKGQTITPEDLHHFSGLSYKEANRVSVASSYLIGGTFDLIVLFIKAVNAMTMHRFAALRDLAPSLPVVVIMDKYETVFCTELVKKGAFAILLTHELSAELINSTLLSALEQMEEGRKHKLMNERYQMVSQATNDMIYEYDIYHNKVYRDPYQFVKLTGFTEPYLNLAGEFWLNQIHPKDKDWAADLLTKSLADEKTQTFSADYRFLISTGEYRYFNDKGFIRRDKYGIAKSVLGAVRDITEQKVKEDELKKLSLIANGTINGIVLADNDGKIQWINQSFTKITGYELHEVIGKSPGSLLQGKDTDMSIAVRMRECVRQNKGFDELILNYKKNGEAYWNKVHVETVYNDVDKKINFIGFQRDVTETKHLNDQLFSVREQYRLLFDRNPLGIVLWDKETGDILEVNKSVSAITGYTKEELLSFKMGPNNADPHFRYKKIPNDFNGFEDFDHPTSFYELITKENKKNQLQVHTYPITLGDKEALVSIGIDITSQLKTTRKINKLRSAQELKLKRAVNSGREQEMAFVGRELHDNIVQLLASCRLYHKMLKIDGKDNIQFSAKVEEYLDMAMNELRILSHSMVPPSLKENKLIVAIETLLNESAFAEQVQFILSSDTFLEKLYTNEFKVSLYRIAQEQLNNIRKYAKASEVSIDLGVVGGKLIFKIKDNGVGFDVAAVKKGIGLDNISERAKVFLGTMMINSGVNKGVEMIISYPLTKPFWEIAGNTLVNGN